MGEHGPPGPRSAHPKLAKLGTRNEWAVYKAQPGPAGGRFLCLSGQRTLCLAERDVEHRQGAVRLRSFGARRPGGAASSGWRGDSRMLGPPCRPWPAGFGVICVGGNVGWAHSPLIRSC